MGLNKKFIKKIWQIDNECFGIVWNDSKEMQYSLASLQENCPCARCHKIRESGTKPERNPHAKAISIESVGLYAIRIHFKEGCSLGIYDFESLYAMGDV